MVISLTAIDDTTTQLHLAHDGLIKRDVLIGVFAGWHAHFNVLAEVLVGPRVSDFWIITAQLEAEYDERV